jgi:hypothetical protein
MLHANYELEEKGNLDLKSLLEEYMIWRRLWKCQVK